MTTELLEQECVKFPTSRPVVFDRKHALARLGGLDDVLLDVMELMTIESVKVHAEIRQCCNCRDSVGLKLSAHTLKGAASIIGATDLVNRLKRVEGFAVLEQFDNAVAELPEIDRQFAEIQAILHAELQSAKLS